MSATLSTVTEGFLFLWTGDAADVFLKGVRKLVSQGAPAKRDKMARLEQNINALSSFVSYLSQNAGHIRAPSQLWLLMTKIRNFTVF